MQLQELYRRLSVGHFSNLSLGNDGAGTLSAKGEAATKLHLNAALRSLAKRLVLREDCLIVQTETGRTLYDMTPAHAVSQQDAGGSGPFYIMDTEEEPFTGGFIKATRVYADNGTELSLNEADNPLSIFTPSATQIQIPTGLGIGMFAVNYKTFLPKVDPEAESSVEFELPEVLETPVQLYIAAQVYAGMNGQEQMIKSQTLMQEFERELQVIENEDLLSSSSITYQNKFEARGFA